MAQVNTVTPDGSEIRTRRLHLGLSPDDLASKLGRGRHGQTIRRIERGAIPRVSVLLIHQIALALGADVAAITSETPVSDGDAA